MKLYQNLIMAGVALSLAVAASAVNAVDFNVCGQVQSEYSEGPIQAGVGPHVITVSVPAVIDVYTAAPPHRPHNNFNPQLVTTITTDESGNFDIEGLNAGNYSLVITPADSLYGPAIVPLTVNESRVDQNYFGTGLGSSGLVSTPILVSTAHEHLKPGQTTKVLYLGIFVPYDGVVAF